MINPKNLTPSSIEIEFCEKFKSLNVYELDKEIFEVYLIISKTKKEDYAKIPEVDKLFIHKLIDKRMDHIFTFKINDERLKVILALISSNPAEAIMFLTYLQYWCFKHNVREIDLNYFGLNIFPNGFPSTQDLSLLWKSIKLKDDEDNETNLLDCFHCLESIQFKPIEKPIE